MIAVADRAKSGEKQPDPKIGTIESAWLTLASERTTSVLVIALAAFVAISWFVPKGSDALELAREPNATLIHQVAAGGLPVLFPSAWMYAVFALLAANLFARAVANLMCEPSG